MKGHSQAGYFFSDRGEPLQSDRSVLAEAVTRAYCRWQKAVLRVQVFEDCYPRLMHKSLQLVRERDVLSPIFVGTTMLLAFKLSKADCIEHLLRVDLSLDRICIDQLRKAEHAASLSQ